MTIKIIYHQVKPGVDCPDGIASAWVCRKAHPNAEVIGCWYQCKEEELPIIKEGDRLIIVDFSFPKAILEKWVKLGATILLIDHHKTAQEHLGDISTFAAKVRGEIIFDMDECGATLAWKYFFQYKRMPLFLWYVRDRDLWIKEMQFSDEIHTTIGQLGRTFELFDVLEDLDLEDFETLGSIGRALLAPKRKAIKEIVKRAEYRNIYGKNYYPDHSNAEEGKTYWRIPMVILTKDGSEDYLTSDICEELYTNQFPTAQFVGCLTSDGTMSLRSDKNKPDGGFDVSAIAIQFGGGGHRNAAGFKP